MPHRAERALPELRRRARRACSSQFGSTPARRSTSASTAWSPSTISNRTNNRTGHGSTPIPFTEHRRGPGRHARHGGRHLRRAAPERGVSYAQGQYLTLRADHTGRTAPLLFHLLGRAGQARCAWPSSVSPGGLFSNWAAEHLLPGTSIDVMPPQGPFQRPAGAAVGAPHRGLRLGQRHHAGAVHHQDHAAGRAAQPASRWFYGNRSSSGVMFKEELKT
jgi:hypothetical protein